MGSKSSTWRGDKSATGVSVTFGVAPYELANVTVAKVPEVGLLPTVIAIVPDVSFTFVRETLAPVPAAAPAATVVVSEVLQVTMCPLTVMVPLTITFFTVSVCTAAAQTALLRTPR